MRPPGATNPKAVAARCPRGTNPAKAGLLCGWTVQVQLSPLPVQTDFPVSASTAWTKMPMKGQMPAVK